MNYKEENYKTIQHKMNFIFISINEALEQKCLNV